VPPPGILFVRADPMTGLPAPPGKLGSRLTPFRRGTLPSSFRGTAGDARFSDESFWRNVGNCRCHYRIASEGLHNRPRARSNRDRSARQAGERARLTDREFTHRTDGSPGDRSKDDPDDGGERIDCPDRLFSARV